MFLRQLKHVGSQLIEFRVFPRLFPTYEDSSNRWLQEASRALQTLQNRAVASLLQRLT